jgi:hypothetical protein
MKKGDLVLCKKNLYNFKRGVRYYVQSVNHIKGHEDPKNDYVVISEKEDSKYDTYYRFCLDKNGFHYPDYLDFDSYYFYDYFEG